MSAILEVSEKRLRPRAKIACLLRVRPSLPIENEFDEVLPASNSCRKGCYFVSRETRYQRQMRLFVAFPYSTGRGAIVRDYLGEVVRLEKLPDGKTGVAVSFVSTLSLGAITAE